MNRFEKEVEDVLFTLPLCLAPSISSKSLGRQQKTDPSRQHRVNFTHQPDLHKAGKTVSPTIPMMDKGK